MPSHALTPYIALRPAQSFQLSLRGLHYRYLQWGEPVPGQTPLVLLHGWMDVAASWQFVVDALAGTRCIVAPDWRGFGASVSSQDSFYFPDYVGDVDALLPALMQRWGWAEDSRVDVMGHSMGAHAAMLFASARPERVRRLVNIEGFGAPPTQAAQAPGHLRRWLDSLQALRAGQLDLASYDSTAAVAQRLLKTNPRIAPERAAWLAGHWAEQGSDGRWYIRGSAAHKTLNPVLFRQEEVQACYAAIRAPVLSLLARENRLHEWADGSYSLDAYLQRLAVIAQHELHFIEEAGHMLHHDQPHAAAAAVAKFLHD